MTRAEYRMRQIENAVVNRFICIFALGVLIVAVLQFIGEKLNG